MLTPLQSAHAGAAVSAMQSIAETLEERRREEAEKASGRKDDDVLKRQQAQVGSDDTARQANTRINEHFFGSNARGQDTLAKLVSRFSAMLGISQGDSETGRQFAQRLSDQLALIGNISLPAKGSNQNVTLTTLGTSLSAVQLAMKGNADDAAANLVARLAAAAGVSQGDDEPDADFEQRLSNLLTRQRVELPETVSTLEQKSGLDDLGLKATDLIAAIRNPYGTEAQRVKDALAQKAQDEKSLTPEMRKVLARLEDTADPKSIEELKFERVRPDPTRVEDAEVCKEREETIRSLEAGEKLDDVRDLQDAIGRAQADATKPTSETKKPGSAAADALDTIQLLAAGAQANDGAEKAAAPSNASSSERTGDQVDTTEDAVRDLDAAGNVEKAEREDAKKEIFALRVDDNGIYDLITRQLVA
ncbi:hypothetical protein [Shinella sp.]|uniref:hypothetical protein n=1 Tax=Shinella sp. TaxID=1870904 RepID=UPI00289C1CE5|nr:hypothetical protein [Shinella sp.]